MLVDIIFYDKLCANKMNTAKYYNVEYVSTLTLQANLINTTATNLKPIIQQLHTGELCNVACYWMF